MKKHLILITYISMIVLCSYADVTIEPILVTPSVAGHTYAQDQVTERTDFVIICHTPYVLLSGKFTVKDVKTGDTYKVLWSYGDDFTEYPKTREHVYHAEYNGMTRYYAAFPTVENNCK